jgi:hypothetical protein
MEPILRPQRRQVLFREECRRLLYGHPVKQILEYPNQVDPKWRSDLFTCRRPRRCEAYDDRPLTNQSPT